MPRRPRLYLPGQPQHVVVRGHNRDRVLARHEDFRYLYRCLREAAGQHGLAVHAWVFMHNHLHILATPRNERALPRTMQSLGRRYAQYFNRSYRRSGALWEGRYKAALVDTDRYLLACYRYIELNPVRAGIARRPGDYPYSSFRANALGRPDPLLTPHPVFLGLCGAPALGSESAVPTPTPCRQAYLELFGEALSSEDLTSIRRGTESGLGIGQPAFLLDLARLAGRCS
ncbi:MAG TPA: transposase [Gammaproteobacteria bacterium]